MFPAGSDAVRTIVGCWAAMRRGLGVAVPVAIATVLLGGAPASAQVIAPALHTLTVSTSIADAPAGATKPGKIVIGPAASCDAICTYPLPGGTRVELVAEAFAGSVFRQWAQPALCAEFPYVEERCTVTIGVADVAVTAVFVQGKGTLAVSATGDVAIVSDPPGISCADGAHPSSDCAATFPVGTKVRLTATPTTPGVRVTRWSTWECEPRALICDVTVDGQRAVTAFVVPFVILVKKSGDTSATITPTPTATGYACLPGCPAFRHNIRSGARQVSYRTTGGVGPFRGWAGPCADGPPDVCSFFAFQTEIVVAAYGDLPFANTPLSLEFKKVVVYKKGPGAVSVAYGGPFRRCLRISCSFRIPASTYVTLVPRPKPGARFLRWDGGLCPASKRCRVKAELIDAVRGVFAGPV
jgi:hypothetical protein